jgi:hypothetical protein
MLALFLTLITAGCVDVYVTQPEQNDTMYIAEDQGSPIQDELLGLDCIDDQDSLCSGYLSLRYKGTCVEYHICMLSMPDPMDYRPHICVYLTGTDSCIDEFEQWLCCEDNCNPLRKKILQDYACKEIEDLTIPGAGRPITI